MVDKDVIIVGGGLAGIASAVRLVKQGIKPTLIEQRPFLGGRAFSFTDRSSGEEIDNGQHVILGACTAFLDLLTELGTRHQIDLQPVLDVPVSHGGKTSQLRASRLLGNATALFRYGQLSFPDRVSVARVMLGLKFTRSAYDETERTKSISFADWLTMKGQSESGIARFWSLFILPVFNCQIDEVTAYDAIEFTRTALLGRPLDAAIGFPKCGLSSLIGRPAQEYLSTTNAEIMTGVRVQTIELSRTGGFEIRLSTGEDLCSQVVISGLAPNILSGVLPKSDARFDQIMSALTAFEYSPIVAVHLWYERPVMEERVKAFVDLGLQWVFNDTALRGSSSRGTQHIVISLSGADEWVEMSKREILDGVQEAMRIAFPATREHRVINSAVVITPEATIKVNPASGTHRIGAETEVPGLYLAGDWTDTGLPATMEGAVQSGNKAADLAIDALRT